MRTNMTIMKKLGGMLVAVVLGIASLAAQGGVTYFHNDIAGSPVAATNEAGAVVWRESYRPYGERRINSASASDNKVWFTSRRQDVDTGLVYMGARYYDPVVGRFISMDPAAFDEGNLHSHNRYAYANNNPYKYVDPDGRSPLSVVALEVAKATGVGYGLGVMADALSQYAAWGSVDLGLATTSNAAVAGGASGLLAGVAAGVARAATAAHESAETFKIIDGVRRAKAAEMSGKATISAEVEGASGKVAEVAIRSLRSPKEAIETAGAGAGRWERVLQGTRDGAELPPILVRPGSSGIPVKDVKIQQEP